MRNLTIEFKAKIRNDGQTKYIKVPVFTTSHCDMHAFRTHRKYGDCANSDLFLAVLARIRRDLFGGAGLLRLDALPPGVTVDASRFLALVTVDVDVAK